MLREAIVDAALVVASVAAPGNIICNVFLHYVLTFKSMFKVVLTLPLVDQTQRTQKVLTIRC